MASSSHRAVWALYDLSLPGRIEALAGDADELCAAGGRILTVGGVWASQAAGLIDGFEMEAQWLLQPSHRATLYVLRTDLSSSVDGEVFLRGARRAVALAARINVGPAPQMLFGAGLAESLAVWLASRLTGIPFVATLEDDPRWAGKLLEQIRAEAAGVCTSSLSGILGSLSSQVA